MAPTRDYLTHPLNWPELNSDEEAERNRALAEEPNHDTPESDSDSAFVDWLFADGPE